MQVGVLAPEAVATGKLCTGQVGYLITGMKTTKSARVGDTWHLAKQPVEALSGFKPAKSMVFSGQQPQLSLVCHSTCISAGNATVAAATCKTCSVHSPSVWASQVQQPWFS